MKECEIWGDDIPFDEEMKREMATCSCIYCRRDPLQEMILLEDLYEFCTEAKFQCEYPERWIRMEVLR